jgi:hypothetical protein
LTENTNLPSSNHAPALQNDSLEGEDRGKWEKSP